MSGLQTFYLIVLILGEIASIILGYSTLQLFKEAKADGKITKEEYKEVFFSSFVTLAIMIAIIMSVLGFLGIIKV